MGIGRARHTADRLHPAAPFTVPQNHPFRFIKIGPMSHPDQEFRAVQEKCEQFRTALDQIVGRQFDMDLVPLDQISRRFREVIKIAKDALK